MTSKKYLEEIQDLEARIKEKEEDIQDLWEAATFITTPSGTEPVQTSNISDKVGTNAVKIAAMVQELEQMKAIFISERAKRIKAIDAIEKTLHRTILRQKYVKYKELTDIAEEIGYSYQYIVEQHGEALKKVKIL